MFPPAANDSLGVLGLRYSTTRPAEGRFLSVRASAGGVPHCGIPLLGMHAASRLALSVFPSFRSRAAGEESASLQGRASPHKKLAPLIARAHIITSWKGPGCTAAESDTSRTRQARQPPSFEEGRGYLFSHLLCKICPLCLTCFPALEG